MQKKNVLFSDANHGGLILLEEYYKYTNNNLFFYDIYNKLSDNEKKVYNDRFNVKFLSLDEIKTKEDEFVKINPVHMPPVISTDYTHHEFVSYLLNKNDYEFKIIQVTGVKGKTSVTTILKHILEDYNTLVLTSNSLTFNDEMLIEHLSIAPASIIVAINKAKEKDIINDIDYCIFEVSLGAVPEKYLNILTNIVEDYPIAKKSCSASVAKRSAFSSEITLCDYDSYIKYYDGMDAITISYDNTSSDIYASDVDYDIENTRFVINYFDKKYDICRFALSDFYINNLLFGVSVGLLVGIDMKTIISKLEKDYEIRGRNSYRKIKDKIIIEDINPGLNTASIKKCIENLEKFGMDPLIIIGGDYGITCEEIDEEKLLSYIKTINNKNIIMAGEVGKKLAEKSDEKHKTFESLDDATKYALNKKEFKLIQIIYRSEYTKHESDLNYL